MDSLIRGCNVYVFQTNQRLRLDTFKLPVLKREMIDHFLGGGFFIAGPMSRLGSLRHFSMAMAKRNTSLQ